MPAVDLVADIGESFGAWTMGDDERIVEVLTSANVACGFHAGDPLTMRTAVRQCLERGVAVGAHPGFRDLHGFGRRTLDMTREEVATDVLYQLGALAAFVAAEGGRLTHLSPHGRLGNLTVTEERYAAGVLDAVEAFDPDLLVLGQPGLIHDLAAERGIPAARLGFPDRACHDDGTLVSRREPGAVLHDAEEIAARAVQLAVHGTVTSVTGAEVAVTCEAILLHGDNAASVDAARTVRRALEGAGVTIRALRPPTGAPA